VIPLSRCAAAALASAAGVIVLVFAAQWLMAQSKRAGRPVAAAPASAVEHEQAVRTGH
jgi:hypothetical protein